MYKLIASLPGCSFVTNATSALILQRLAVGLGADSFQIYLKGRLVYAQEDQWSK